MDMSSDPGTQEISEDQEMSNDEFFRAHAQVVRERKAQACRDLHELHAYENNKKLQPLFLRIEKCCRMRQEAAIERLVDDKAVTKKQKTLWLHLKTHDVEKKASSFGKAVLAAIVYPLARDEKHAVASAQERDACEQAWKAELAEAAARRALAVSNWYCSMKLTSSDEEVEDRVFFF